MTKEQAKEQLKHDRDLCNFNPSTGEDEPISEDCRKSAEALEMAIKALEQPTSDDCVSRAEVFEIMGNLMSIPYDFDRPINEDDVSESMDRIKALPPVTPTRKVGKWIKTGGSFRCSECMAMPEFKDIRTLKYCPNCGADFERREE